MHKNPDPYGETSQGRDNGDPASDLGGFGSMRMTKLAVLTAAIAAMGLMGALATSASADSITCEISGAIKLSPGLTESPQVQNLGITRHKGALLSNCTGAVETKVTGGNLHVVGKTTEAVTCAALKGTGAKTEDAGIFKWQPKGEGFENSPATLNFPVTENSVAIEGTVAMGTFPFSEDKISGMVKQTYGGTCGSSGGHGHGGGKKVNKGTFTGSITIS